MGLPNADAAPLYACIWPLLLCQVKSAQCLIMLASENAGRDHVRQSWAERRRSAWECMRRPEPVQRLPTLHGAERRDARRPSAQQNRRLKRSGGASTEKALQLWPACLGVHVPDMRQRDQNRQRDIF